MGGFPKGNARKGEKATQARPGVPLNKTIILECIKAFNGNLSRVADHIGSNRSCVRRLIDSDPDMAQALKDSRERQIDRLEDVVFARAEDSQDTALQLFILKTQARHRGWEQDEAKNMAKDIAQAAFAFILDKSKNPAEPTAS